jgi:cysteine desulfurase
MRAGTENVVAAVGLAMAFERAETHREERQRTIARLRDRLRQGLISRIPRIFVNGGETGVAGILNVSFEGVDGEAMVIALDQEGICVATGSACASLATEPSHVLAALGMSPKRIRGALRFSLSHENTSEEIDTLIGSLERLANRLRALSPVWKD